MISIFVGNIYHRMMLGYFLVCVSASLKTVESTSDSVVLAIIHVKENSSFLEESLKDTFRIFKTVPHVFAEIHAGFREFHLIENFKQTLLSSVNHLILLEKNSTSLSVMRIKRRCQILKCHSIFITDSRVHFRLTISLTFLLSLNLTAVGPILDSVVVDERNAEFWELGDEWIPGVHRARRIKLCVLLRKDALIRENCSVRTLTDHLGDVGQLFATTDARFGNFLLSSMPFLKKILPEHQSHEELWHFVLNLKEWEERYLNPLYFSTRQSMKFEQPCPGVYWIPFFSARFCAEVIEVAENSGLLWNNVVNSKTPHRVYRTGNGTSSAFATVDLKLRQIYYHEMFALILYHYLKPIEKRLFPWRKYNPMQIHPFIVRYRLGEQTLLKPHIDQAQVSLNIALNRKGRDFRGGGTRFVHRDCSIPDTRLGWALFHANKFPDDLHEALPLINGTRYVLVTFLQ